jgi:hypothetical protein
VTNKIQENGASGELILTVFAAIAKFPRQQIVKGTREGPVRAVRRIRPRAHPHAGAAPRAIPRVGHRDQAAVHSTPMRTAAAAVA